MFSYIMLGTNDLPRAITFYDPLMEMLGYRWQQRDYLRGCSIHESYAMQTTSDCWRATLWLPLQTLLPLAPALP